MFLKRLLTWWETTTSYIIIIYEKTLLWHQPTVNFSWLLPNKQDNSQIYLKRREWSTKVPTMHLDSQIHHGQVSLYWPHMFNVIARRQIRIADWNNKGEFCHAWEFPFQIGTKESDIFKSVLLLEKNQPRAFRPKRKQDTKTHFDGFVYFCCTALINFIIPDWVCNYLNILKYEKTNKGFCE